MAEMPPAGNQDWTLALLLWPWPPFGYPWERYWLDDPAASATDVQAQIARSARVFARDHHLQNADAEDLVQEYLLERLRWFREHADQREFEYLAQSLQRAESKSAASRLLYESLPRLFPRGEPPQWPLTYHPSPFWRRFIAAKGARLERRQLRTQPLSTAAYLAAPLAYQPESAIEAEEAITLIARAAEQLPSGLAALYTLAGRLELTRTEQAAALGVSSGRLADMRKQLARSLRESLENKISPSVLALLPRLPRPQPVPREFTLTSDQGKGGRVVEVWYGTNRVPVDSADHTQGYTGHPEPESDVHHGRCRVFIPEGHTWGEIHTPLWKKLLFLWRPSADLKLMSIRHAPEDTFVEALKATLSDKVDREKDILLYVHGYNVTFEAAALRAAQLEVDLNAAGATAFFSWPSRGATEGYLADEDAIQLSEKPLLGFIRLLHERVQARRIHVLVHSMGNRALARLADLFGHLATPVLGEVVLAAPDVNVIQFRDQAKGYKAVASRTTMYASSGDRALLASKTIHAAQRAGQLPPAVVVDGIHTIDVSETDLSFMGHGYYGACEAVLYDMHELFVGGLPPSKRARLQEVMCENGNTYWRIRP